MKNIAIIIALQFLILPLSFAQLTVSMPTITGQAGETIHVPVSIRTNTATNVLTFQFAVQWNDNQLTYIGNDQYFITSFSQDNIGMPSQDNQMQNLIIGWEDYPEHFAVMEEMTLFSLQFIINENVEAGESIHLDFCPSCNEEFYNENFEVLAVTYEMEQNTLPVQFINFTAKNLDNTQVQLNWSTATEFENSHFVVQHSLNGQDWTPLVKIDGKGTSYQIQHYNFLHQKPSFGQNMYRLQQVDWDGLSSLSIIETVEIIKQQSQFTYLNPVTENLQLAIDTPQAQTYSFILYNTKGQLIEQRQINLQKGHQTLVWNMADLTQGLYLLKMIGLETQVLKIVKE